MVLGFLKVEDLLKIVKVFLCLMGMLSMGCAYPRLHSWKKKTRFSHKKEFKKEAPLVFSSQGFQWPLKRVEVTSYFGKRGKSHHEGLDLRAALGTKVYAVQDGLVLYTGTKIRGYGKMVVLRHSNRIASIYAHNSSFFVHRGQKVKRGDLIALSGATGRVRGPHLHFEIRQGVVAIDPLKYLPRIFR
jgi:murein DD-endopeptidase MepM/ murein hydrolase activator NlpD